MDSAGPNIPLQHKPYPHGIVLDPTGRYAVVLDRGADVLRTYEMGWDGRLLELGSFDVTKGIGPRHGVFVRGNLEGWKGERAEKTGVKTYYYALGELTNSLMGFEVTYPWSAASSDGKEVSRGSLGFRLIHNSSAHGTRFGDGSRIALPSDIVATSVPGDDATEKWHLMLSVRNNGRQTSLGEPSDTIASFEVDIGTGVPKLIGLIASGGRWPRTFAVSKDGSFVAVADQYIVPGRLVVFSRDPKTGVIDDSRSLAIWETNTTLLDGQSISHVLWE